MLSHSPSTSAMSVAAAGLALEESLAARLARYFCNPALQILVILVLGFLVRMPALQGQLIWDDTYLAKDNPFMKSPLLILESFRHYLFPDSFSTHYRPVQNISFISDYWIWNTDPYGFHLTNVLLHLGSGVALYFLLRGLGTKFFLNRLPQGGATASSSTSAVAIEAFLIALLWTVHPVHSAAVDFISGRADSLAFLFACGGWLFYLRAGRARGRTARIAFYLAAAFTALLSLCSREIAGIWLCIFLLHLFAFEKQLSQRRKWISLGCCLVLFAVYVGLRHLPEARVSPASGGGSPAPVRAALMLRALGDYGRLMIFPSNLCMDRTLTDPRSYANLRSWRENVGSEYLSIFGLIFLATSIAGSLRRGRGQTMRIFGASWFFLAYLPISNLIDLNANVAEHWLYLPSVGFLIFLAGCVLDLPARHRKVAMALAVLAVMGLSGRAYLRSTDWVTPEIFYRRNLAAGGTSLRVVTNLGLIYLNQGDYAKAETAFRKVLSLYPEYPTARNNLADALYRQGKHAEAEALLASTAQAGPENRKEYPRTWIAALQLGYLHHKEKNDPAALAILEQARLDYPHTWEIIRFESELLRQTAGPDAALKLVENFKRENWWHQEATISLGRLLAEKGEIEPAIAALREASRLDVHDAESLHLMAAIRLRQNRLDEARSAQLSAVRRQPDEPSQYRLLSEILFKMGRNSEAEVAVAKIASLEAVAKAHVAVN